MKRWFFKGGAGGSGLHSGGARGSAAPAPNAGWWLVWVGLGQVQGLGKYRAREVQGSAIPPMDGRAAAALEWHSTVAGAAPGMAAACRSVPASHGQQRSVAGLALGLELQEIAACQHLGADALQRLASRAGRAADVVLCLAGSTAQVLQHMVESTVARTSDQQCAKANRSWLLARQQAAASQGSSRRPVRAAAGDCGSQAAGAPRRPACTGRAAEEPCAVRSHTASPPGILL